MSEADIERLSDSDRLPLSGVRVVAVGSTVAVAFASRWLWALGCELNWIIRPGEKRFDESRARYLEVVPPSASLDLSKETNRKQLNHQFERADLLLDATGPGVLQNFGLAPWDAPESWPGLASVSVTPFGDHGPHTHLPSNPLTLGARSGMFWHVGRPEQPPLAQAGEQISYLAGLHTFGAALSAIYSNSRGVPVHYELSEQACGAAVIGHHTARVSQIGERLPRVAPRALWRLYPTTDGWSAVAALPRNYPRLAEVMELPLLAEASPFLDHSKRPLEEARITEALTGWFATRSNEEITALALRESVPLAPVLSIPQVAQSEQLAHRNFFARVGDEGQPEALLPRQLWRSSGHGWRSPASLPAQPPEQNKENPRPESNKGGSTARRMPLEGVRVLDLGQIWAGPYAAMLLADQGADVIKVESPKVWDPNRCAAVPPRDRSANWWNTGTYFQEYSRNKRSFGVDIRNPRGRELLGQLVTEADIVIENLRADVLDRLEIGYDWMREQRNDVILVSMAAYGKSGPESSLPGYGPLIEALSGLANQTGWGDGEPHLTTGFAYGDPVAAVAAASAAIAALVQRDRSGCGQHIDLAQRDVATALMGEALAEWSTTGHSPEPQGNGHRTAAPHGVFRCTGEDEWVAIAITSDEQWRGLIAMLDAEDWAADASLGNERARHARRTELEERVESFTQRLSKMEVLQRCAEHKIPVGAVQRPFELLEDPQLMARGFYETPSHPDMGSWEMHGWEWRPRDAGACVRKPGPDFGAHNADILRELGVSEAEQETLEAEGVIASSPVGIPPLPWERA